MGRIKKQDERVMTGVVMGSSMMVCPPFIPKFWASDWGT